MSRAEQHPISASGSSGFESCGSIIDGTRSMGWQKWSSTWWQIDSLPLGDSVGRGATRTERRGANEVPGGMDMGSNGVVHWWRADGETTRTEKARHGNKRKHEGPPVGKEEKSGWVLRLAASVQVLPGEIMGGKWQPMETGLLLMHCEPRGVGGIQPAP
ncbi:uncharacterized protein BBA_06795 [Beauveria bassiana ARSEF 2860]|uniref:Uncharacterized protein n=1 Tax=Beauveria bassiana (strain ARSEF 2860) TaxID=655819 RepID=J5JF09_BEAB2|nr:uncharacterized protein BBA_06795 [Beauveria bassiana ARSEF 2860]EJP64413.1 hypothetical protein BBA_06795 [Beauveria bassiana ARSEF 2860]